MTAPMPLDVKQTLVAALATSRALVDQIQPEPDGHAQHEEALLALERAMTWTREQPTVLTMGAWS